MTSHHVGDQRISASCTAILSPTWLLMLRPKMAVMSCGLFASAGRAQVQEALKALGMDHDVGGCLRAWHLPSGLPVQGGDLRLCLGAEGAWTVG